MGQVGWKKVSALQKHLRKGKRGAAEGGCLLYGIREGRRGGAKRLREGKRAEGVQSGRKWFAALFSSHSTVSTSVLPPAVLPPSTVL